MSKLQQKMLLIAMLSGLAGFLVNISASFAMAGTYGRMVLSGVAAVAVGAVAIAVERGWETPEEKLFASSLAKTQSEAEEAAARAGGDSVLQRQIGDAYEGRDYAGAEKL